MEKVTCCFTGHRDVPEDQLERVKTQLAETVSALIEEGYTAFVAGGAIGFDTLAENAVLEARKSHPEITLHLALPCHNQDKKWNAEQKAEYKRIVDEANSYDYACETYTKWCMAKRNKAMVNMSSVVIAYYNGKGIGGTAMTVDFAEKKGIRIINLF